MFLKNEVVNNLMDGVFLLVNVNMEFNVCWREVFWLEFYVSYRYFCVFFNLIFLELFGDDLFKVVKDIIDINRIILKF